MADDALFSEACCSLCNTTFCSKVELLSIHSTVAYTTGTKWFDMMLLFLFSWKVRFAAPCSCYLWNGRSMGRSRRLLGEWEGRRCRGAETQAPDHQALPKVVRTFIFPYCILTITVMLPLLSIFSGVRIEKNGGCPVSTDFCLYKFYWRGDNHILCLFLLWSTWPARSLRASISSAGNALASTTPRLLALDRRCEWIPT